MYLLRKIGFFLLVAVMVAACATKPPESTPQESPPDGDSASTQPESPDPSAPQAAELAPLDPAVTVKIAEDGSPSGAGFYIATEKGYFAELGLKPEFVSFQGSGDMLPALATDQVQVAGGVTTLSLWNAIAGGVDVRIVGDKGKNYPGAPYFALVIRQDLAGEIKDYKDLKGRTLALAGTGGIDEIMLARALAKGGLTMDDIDLKVIQGFPNLTIALANKSIDGAMQIEPLITKGIDDGVMSIFGDPSEYAPGTQVAMVLASPAFAENKELANRFMVAYVKALRDYNDAFQKDKGTDEIISIMAQYTALKDEQLWHKVNVTGLSPDNEVDMEAVAADLQWFRDHKGFNAEMDLNKVIDLSATKFALEHLGPYE